MRAFKILLSVLSICSVFYLFSEDILDDFKVKEEIKEVTEVDFPTNI